MLAAWCYSLWLAIALWWPSYEQVNAWNVALCESSGDPLAVNGVHLGTWQMDYELHGTVSINVYDQAAQAYHLWDKTEDWSAWECRP